MIRKIINTAVSLFVLCAFTTQSAHASVDMTRLYTTDSVVNIVLLMCAIICLIWSLKILALVRGGLMSKSWQMFVLGFCFLILAQLLVVGENAGLFLLPSYVSVVLYLCMVSTWLAGLYQTRKVLG